ncbi:hypothetical protein ACFL6P_05530 [Candidatus Latescibacterota bacterium]
MCNRITTCAILIAVYVGLTVSVNAQTNEKTSDISGEWEINLTFIAGEAKHTAIIKQAGDKLSGIYKGEFKEGNLRGLVKGMTIDFTGRLKHESTGLYFHYTGTIEGDKMKGIVDMGEYWTAEFTAIKKKDLK